MFDTDEEAIIAQNIIEEVLGSVFPFPSIITTVCAILMEPFARSV